MNFQSMRERSYASMTNTRYEALVFRRFRQGDTVVPSCIQLSVFETARLLGDKSQGRALPAEDRERQDRH